MSLTRIGTVIRNPFTGKAITAKAPVDTGIILTVVPRRVADELQLPVIKGRATLETLGLEVDITTGKLKEVTTYLL